MATAISSQSIDPTRGARFPITINEQLVRDDRSRKRQRISVQCNRRPNGSGPSTTTIRPSPSGNGYELALSNSEEGEYTYDGVQRPSSAVALFYDPTEKSFTLDKLDAGFQFELRTTPGQVHALGIHSGAIDGIGIGDGEQEDLFGGESGGDDEDTTPDLNNPYDYRHYLNKGNRSPSPAPSYAASPAPQPITFNSSPVLPAVKSSRPPKAKPSPSRPSRPKQRTQEKPRYLSPKPRQEELDADNEDSDPDELVIDMGDSPPTNNTTTNSRPWRSALSVLNEGGRSSAPFSLRSAASSMSPSLRGGSPSDEDEEGDGKALEMGEDDDQGDVNDDDDDDIEEIDLGNTNSTADPDQKSAAPPPPPEEAVTPGNGWDADDDDELEAELALALEEDQAKSDIEEAARATSVNNAASLVAANGGGESSEESEEE